MKKLILVLLFLSGATGLTYEILCMRVLSLVFGSTTYAVSIVLASFMCGLAIGSWYFGKKVDRLNLFPRLSINHFTIYDFPLTTYGFLMLGTGIYFLLTPWLVELVKFINTNISSGYIKSNIEGIQVYVLSPINMISTFAFSFILVLIPTMLMGGTLPVLTKYFSYHASHISQNVGLLYSINTWGAVVGAFLCGYFLIMWFGVKGTVYLTGVINILIGFMVLFLTRGFRMFFFPVLMKNNCSHNGSKEYHSTNKYYKSYHSTLPPSNNNPNIMSKITPARPKINIHNLNFSAATICANTNPAKVYLAKSYKTFAKLLRCFLFSFINNIVQQIKSFVSLMIKFAVLLLAGSFSTFFSPVRVGSRTYNHSENDTNTEQKNSKSIHKLYSSLLKKNIPISRIKNTNKPIINEAGEIVSGAASFATTMLTKITWAKLKHSLANVSFCFLPSFIKTIIQKIRIFVNSQYKVFQTDATNSSHISHYIILIVIAISGFTALAYEVLWSRTLTMILGSSTYAFTTMLCSFLVGIALGSLIYTKISGSTILKDAKLQAQVSHYLGITQFGFIQAGIGVSVLLLIPVFGILPFIFLKLFKMVGSSFVGIQFIQFIICFTVMLIPTTLFGMTIPLAVEIVSRKKLAGGSEKSFSYSPSKNVEKCELEVGSSVGNVYAANTIGAVMGSLLAGFTLIPWLGLQKSITMVAVVNIMMAIVFLLSDGRRHFMVANSDAEASRYKSDTKSSHYIFNKKQIVLCYVIVLFLIFFTVSYILLLPQWNKKIISSGVYIYAKNYGLLPMKTFKDTLEQFQETIFYKEGKHFNVSVFRNKQHGSLFLRIDGKTDASTTPGDMSTQLLSANIPLMLSKNLDNVLVIGLASGITLGQVARYPIKEIDCVEIEPSMIEASKYFSNFNNNVLNDKRVNIFLDDGRNYLLKTHKKYDAIISEPTNVWITGSSQLFTKEYFKICRSKIKDGGIVAQWLQIYQLPLQDIQSVLKTFFDVFEYGSVWLVSRSDLLLLGSNHPVNNTKLPISVIAKYIMSRDNALKFCGDIKMNIDDRICTEFSAPKFFYNDEIYETNRKTILSHAEVPETLANVKALLDAYIRSGSYYQSEKLVRRQLANSPQDVFLLNTLGYIYLCLGDTKKAGEMFEKVIKINPGYAPALGNLSQFYLVSGEIEKAKQVAKKLVRISPRSAEAWNNLGMVYFQSGELNLAEEMFRKSIEVNPKFALGYFNLATLNAYKKGNLHEGIKLLLKAVEFSPENIDFYLELAKMYGLSGETDKMYKVYEQISQLDPHYF